MSKRGRGRPKGHANATPKKPSPEKGQEAGKPSSTIDSNKPRPGVSHLGTKPGKLNKLEVSCPICWSLLYEPCTLPCNHTLCQACFRKHVDETSLTCPCCRRRLSVWSRTAMRKGNSIIDEVLWARIKAEFPRLVEARILGEDSQNIMMEDDEVQMPTLTPESPSLLDSPSPSIFVRDGTMCEEPGEIRTELQQVIEQHQKDIENERLREETASAQLIRQLEEEENHLNTTSRTSEEEDFLFAQRLQEELQKEEQQSRISTRKSTSAERNKNPGHCRNLMNDWANATPSSSYVSATPSSIKQSRTSGKAKGKRNSNSKHIAKVSKKIPCTVTSSDVSRASQDFMNRFLSSSQSQISPPVLNASATDGSHGIPNHDINFSAFSPTKASSNLSIGVLREASILSPCTSVITRESIADSMKTVIPLGDMGNSKTPDSINSEVDRHFRPIRGAPKTPPRKRADGTFLPEPTLIRTTPVRPSTSASASIVSPLKQIFDKKPSCATIEKRVSNDSGRGSDDSSSPDVEVNSPASSGCKGSDNPVLSSIVRSDQADRGRTSEDYRVTPESDDSGTIERSKKRLVDEEPFMSPNAKKVKVEMDTHNSLQSGSDNQPIVKIEPTSPDTNAMKNNIKGSPLKITISCSQSQEVITIDDDNSVYMELETKALEVYRLKCEQEAADRAFAEDLQRSLNRGISNPRGKNSGERYSLRSWLKPQVIDGVVVKEEVERND